MRKLLILFFLTVPAIGQVEIKNLGDTLYWDANTEPDLVDYGVYRSTAPCVDATPSPVTCPAFAEVAAVAQGPDPRQWIEPGPIIFLQDYFYRVTARNTSGLESGFSNELNLRWLNPNAPAAPGDFRGEEQGARIDLEWDEVARVNAYNLYKSGIEDLRGGMITHTSQREYRDINPGAVGPRYYRVTAVNDHGYESQPAGPVVYVGRRGQDSRGNPIP